MRRESFRNWLVTVQGHQEQTANSRLSNCSRVEIYEGDLDSQWAKDELAALISRLTYSREDERSGRRPKHRIPINGDAYDGTSTLRQAIVLYREFRHLEKTATCLPKTPNKRQPRVQRAKPSKDRWPVWPQPNDKDLLALAQALAPLVRFLNPDIVYTVVQDNRRLGTNWSSVLQALGIDPNIYLWEGSPCTFPGVRRYVGSEEQAILRKQAAPKEAPPQCIKLDDNDYPKHLEHPNELASLEKLLSN